jgi:DNA-binding SARP family transcriptional activator
VHADDELCVRAFGTLEIHNGGVWNRINSDRERSLLACLLLDPNQFVQVSRLSDWMWGDEPPQRPQKVLGTYASRLRRALNETDLRIEFHGGGYRVVIEPTQLDLLVFERGCAEGVRAFEDGAPGRAAAVLDDALRLWRDQPFADVAGIPRVDMVVDRLTEVRMNALEIRVQAVMAESVTSMNTAVVGSLVADLRRLVTDSPLRERLWYVLMQALCLAGRPAEAVKAYLSCRTALADELGVQPGPQLRSLYGEILANSFDVRTLSRRCLPV